MNQSSECLGLIKVNTKLLTQSTVTCLKYRDNCSDIKDHINNVFVANETAKCSKDGCVVLLDGSQMRTTKALLNCHVNSKRIYIAETDHNTSTFMKSQTKNQDLIKSTHICEATIQSFIYYIYNRNVKLSMLYLDFMHSVITPTDKQCMCQAMEMCTQKSMICITISMRNKAGITAKRKIENLISYLHLNNATNKRIQTNKVYGYKRANKFQTMCFLSLKIGDEWPICETEYRPAEIMQSLPNEVLVRWWLYPKQEDWTWQNKREFLMDMQMARTNGQDQNLKQTSTSKFVHFPIASPISYYQLS